MREGNVRMEGELGVIQLLAGRAKECRQPPEDGEAIRMESSLWLPLGTHTCHHLDFSPL